MKSFCSNLSIVSLLFAAMTFSFCSWGHLNCADVALAGGPSVVEQFFTTTLRGHKIKIRYITNFTNISRAKPLVFVIPGLSKEAFEEQVSELEKQGFQAVSLDLTNIGPVRLIDEPVTFGDGTGFLKEQEGEWIIEKPTPEEDAQLVQDLLMHLQWPRAKPRAPLSFLTHSRGALVFYRWFKSFGDVYPIQGVVQQNPYLGWISDYLNSYHAQLLGSVAHLMTPSFPMLPEHFFTSGWNFWSETMNGFWEGVSEVTRENAEAQLDWFSSLFINLHDREKTHLQISELIHSNDSVEIEKIRQKLLGMEGSVVEDEIERIASLDIPMMYVRSAGLGDQLVPFHQVDSIAERFDFPVVSLEGSHYLPYEKPELTVRTFVDFIFGAQ